MLIDLHCHTRRHSWDADLDPHDLIERARRAGLDGVCLTEHDFFWDPEEAGRLAKEHGFLVLAGVEINTENGHMLCFGLDSYVFGMHRVQDLAGHVRRVGGVMIAAHPYRRSMPWHPQDESQYAEALQRAAANPALGFCCAVEWLNGRGSRDENAFAGRVADTAKLPGVAGSDSHSAGDVGRCATELPDDVTDLRGLIGALQAGRCSPVWLAGAG